jgi:hypothetical protein
MTPRLMGGVPITQAGLDAALRASPFVTCADLTAELDARFCAHCEQFNKDLKGLSTTISTNINRLTQDMPDLILEHLMVQVPKVSVPQPSVNGRWQPKKNSSVLTV